MTAGDIGVDKHRDDIRGGRPPGSGIAPRALPECAGARLLCSRARVLEDLSRTLRPYDVILVEGDGRISVAIKHLTPSTWSHAALLVGNAPGDEFGDGPHMIETNLTRGVRAAPISELASLHVRVCRPVGLSGSDCGRVIAYTSSRIGHRYDMKNVLDLARYLLPTPPVPVRLRRRPLALGSGDPTRAIGSTMIAQAFQSVRYPILPDVERVPARQAGCDDCGREIHHIRTGVPPDTVPACPIRATGACADRTGSFPRATRRIWPPHDGQAFPVDVQIA